MAIRTALLNWNNISRDTDFSKYIESVSEPWVIEWLEVSATKVWIWKAFVPCLRTNGETIYALVYISSEVSISGNGDVFIQVSQTYIDDWELANEDWTGIATIQVWTMPSKNALKLATISNWTVTDARNMIPKVWELNTQIESIFDSLEDLDERVEKLEEAWAIDHLEESGLVGELYTLNDTLFKQNTPTLADSTLDCNVSDVAANSQIHIQRIASGVASNQLKLKVKMVGSSTQNLKVEVRKWVQVTVTEWVEAYWYWNQVVASGSIAYSDISSDYAEKTITLDNNFWWTKGELLDVVVYMDTVNASNYYCVACDSTQYSEWFSYVSVNGSTRTRSKLMPYCLSDGFAQSLLCKTKLNYFWDILVDNSSFSGSYNTESTLVEFTALSNWKFNFSTTASCYGGSGRDSYIRLYKNNTVIDSRTSNNTSWYEEVTFKNIPVNKWDIINVTAQWFNSSYKLSLKTLYADIRYMENLNVWVGGTPKQIKTIWEFIVVHLYGNNDKGVYKGGIITWTTESVETGSITLWNAVWFLEINYNGQIVKVPYYN